MAVEWLAWWKSGTKSRNPRSFLTPRLRSKDPCAQLVYCNYNSVSKAYSPDSLQMAALTKYGKKQEPHQVHLDPSGSWIYYKDNDLWETWNYLINRLETSGIQSQYKTFVLGRADIHETSFGC